MLNTVKVNVETDTLNEESQEIIFDILSSDNPCMIARFGSLELDLLAREKNKTRHSLIRYKNFITNKLDHYSADYQKTFEGFNNNGLFPKTKSVVDRFNDLMLADMSELDVLGKWRKNETLFDDELASVHKVKLSDLEPYYFLNPWSKALKGKKVLVIHPFDKTIQSQYSTNRDKIFSNKSILPDFTLITYKPVQSIAGVNTGFDTWFDALNFMKDEISSIDFDVAIIGCGAYGFPLAAHVKRIGKKAVHMGGSTQLLFGIRGKRWENDSRFTAIMNEYWVRPSIDETPKGAKSIEGGCYW